MHPLVPIKQVSGITTIGDANSDTLTINAKVNSAIVPSHDATAIDDADGIDIGTTRSTDHFRVIYATKFDGALQQQQIPIQNIN